MFPLISGGYAHITRIKWHVLAVAAPAGLVLALIPAIAGHAPRPALRRNPPLWVLAGYLGWMTLCGLFGSQGLIRTGRFQPWLTGCGRYEGLLALILYAMVFLSLSLQAGRTDVLRWAAAGGLLLFAGVTALQYAGLNPLELSSAGLSVRTNYEFQSTIGNIDMNIGYLSLAVPFLLLPWLTGGGRAGAVWCAAGLTGFELILMMQVQAGLAAMGVLFLYGFFLALRRPAVRSRGLLLAALACLCVLLRLSVRLPWLDGVDEIVLTLPRGRAALATLLAGLAAGGLAVCFRFFPGRPWPRGLALLAVAAVCAAALAAVARLPISPEAGGLWEAHELLNGRLRDSFGSERIGVWRTALEIIRRHPVFGTGPDGFQAEASGAMAHLGITLAQSFDNPHSLFLWQGVSGGIPGLVLFPALAAVLLARCRRRGDEGRVLAGCILCWLAQGVFTFSICLTSPMAWAIFGLAALPDHTGQPSRRPDP